MVQDKASRRHVPVWDRSERKDDGTLPSSEFVWNEQANEYRCPQGHALLIDASSPSRVIASLAPARSCTAPASDCTGCPMKQQCCRTCPTAASRARWHERSRDVARAIAETRRSTCSPGVTAKKVEMLFAHLKRILKLDRLRLRGLTGAHDEFCRKRQPVNLRRMAKRLTKDNRVRRCQPERRSRPRDIPGDKKRRSRHTLTSDEAPPRELVANRVFQRNKSEAGPPQPVGLCQLQPRRRSATLLPGL